MEPKKDVNECDHSVLFDLAEAAGLSSSEVQKKFPRLDGRCEICGYEGLAYASVEHYYAGDW